MTDPLTAFCFIAVLKIGQHTQQESRDCFTGAHAEIICKNAQSDALKKLTAMNILNSITQCKESRGA